MCNNCAFDCLNANENSVSTNNCFDNWTCEFLIRNESKIEINNNQFISSGDKTVFELHNFTQGDLNVADDELGERLIFEIDSEKTSFMALDSELEDLVMNFRRECFCEERDFKKVSSGCIQGEMQQNGEWRVQAKILVDYNFGTKEINLDAMFSF